MSNHLYKNSDIVSINYDSNTIFIKWQMTTWCNYHCPYCIQPSRYGNILFEDESKMLSIADNLNKCLYSNNVKKPIFLRLLGGECTYYNIEKILSKINNVATLSLVTNFSKDLDYFKSLYNYCRNSNISLNLTLSYHEENLNFWDKALDLNNWCLEKGFKCPEISVVVNENTDFNVINTYKSCGINRIKLVVQKRSHNIKKELSSDIESKISTINKNITSSKGAYRVLFKDGSEKYFSSMSVFINELDSGGFIPKDFYCDAGISSLFISPSGELYRNPCKFLRNDTYKLGGLLDSNNIKLPNNSILCGVNNLSELERCNLCHHNNLYRKEC